jgi:hypothetical protein
LVARPLQQPRLEDKQQLRLERKPQRRQLPKPQPKEFQTHFNKPLAKHCLQKKWLWAELRHLGQLKQRRQVDN